MLNEVRNIKGEGLISWAPQCDIRNCGLGALRLAVLALRDEAHWPPWYREVMGTDSDRLGAAAAKFAQALRGVIGPDGERAHDELGEALVAADFFAEPAAVRALLLAEFARYLVGMMVHAHKTFTMVGEEIPYRAALEALLAAAPMPADELGARP
jgi:hypothetical protein